MNIYDLLQEENQRFWNFLDLDQALLDAQDLDIKDEAGDYLIEELESV